MVTGTQTLYARITSGGTGRTEVDTVTPSPPEAIQPNGPDTGNLNTDPATYAEGDNITISANFPDGNFLVTLYKETAPNVWTSVGTDQSNSQGNAYFLNFPVNGTQKLFARKNNGDRTEVDVIAPAPSLTLSVRRNCTGSNCGSNATAYGELDPATAGRLFKLQRKSGSSWVSVAGAAQASTGADGKVQIQFPLAEVPVWTARAYRLANASGATQVSNQILFMPGPTQLGTNVLRVDVANGIFPSTKGPEYTGEATLSVNGVTPTQLDHVPLESFGVRGSSTATYAKKPFKLKFLDKPPSGQTVFGMLRAKSWTLLANYKDQSAVRDKVALELGRRMGNIAWTPDSRYVELFLNDRYQGAYLMTESVKIDEDRINVDETEGMVMETDGATVADSTLGFKSTIGKIVFAFKDPDEHKSLEPGDTGYPGVDPTGVTAAKLQAIKNRINAFETKLYSASTRQQYPGWIDVDSAIDFHLVQEFVKNGDGAFWRSHYFSWDPSDPNGTSGNPLRDGKFHFGPVWDFDGSAGNACCDSWADYVVTPQGWVMRGTGTGSGDLTYKTHWFVQLFQTAGFEAAVEQRWGQIRTEFEKVYLTDIAAAKAAVGVGAANDRNRWAAEPKPRASRGTYDQEVAYVKNWYEDRFAWMDQQLSN